MPRYTEAQLERVLVECKGMTFVAARRLGCSHLTMNARIAKSPRLQAVIAEQTGQLLDTAELKLAQAVTNGDLGAIKYLLSTKGRGRGYGERVDIHVILRQAVERVAAEEGLDVAEVLAQAEGLLAAGSER